MEAYAPLFGFLGTCFVSIINFTPIPGFIGLWKTKDLKMIPHTFFVLNNLNSVLWLSMGVATGTADVVRSNTIAVIFTTMYLLIYHLVKGDLVTFFPPYAALMGSIFYGLVTYLDGGNITRCAGLVNTLMVLSPLEQLKHVFREKDNKYIDMYIMSIALPCSFCWMMFGVCQGIWPMIVPNLIGTLSCSALITMYFAFRKGSTTRGEVEVGKKKK